MKRTLAAACAALSLGAAVAGCNERLTEEPKGFTTTDTFYKTGADLNSAVIATYSSLRGLQWFSTWPIMELASDQARAEKRETNAGTLGPDYLNWDAATGSTGNYWTTMYELITRANLAIAHGPGISTQDAASKAFNLGEAKFLRGYAYMFLTKAYDDVPLLLTPADQANLHPTRTPVEQVQQAAIKDLTEAEAALPATWPGGSDAFGVPTQGRVTKAAAQMALADLYLWRSSFMGKNEWQQASDAAKRVIDSGNWQLFPDYFAAFRAANRGNSEMIFVINNSGVDFRTSNYFQLFYYPRDWGGDQWGGWGLIHPTDWHLNSFQPGDYRHDEGFLYGGCSGGGICVDAFGDGPMPKKWMIKSDNGADWTRGEFDVPIYRYAETLLMYAEAQNELGNSAEAVRYVNLVRARARQGTGKEARTGPADYAGPTDRLSVREAIYMERNWELQFESKRWWDLVRRDGLEPGYWMTSLRQHDGANAERLRPLATYKRRFPIPAGQILANPALTQNSGY